MDIVKAVVGLLPLISTYICLSAPNHRLSPRRHQLVALTGFEKRRSEAAQIREGKGCKPCQGVPTLDVKWATNPLVGESWIHKLEHL